MDSVKEKVAVITGGASGIGYGIAHRCAKEGMKIVLSDIETGPLYKAESKLKQTGAEVLSVQTDVSKADQMDRLAEEAIKKFGTVHLVVNNAGVGGGGVLWELETDYWEWVLGANLWGVIHGVRVFTKLLVEQNEGHIINTASIAGMMSAPGMGPYNVSKHAVVTLSETLYGELRNAGVNVGVSVLCPSYVDTKIYAAERNRPIDPDRPRTQEEIEEQKAIAEAGAAFFKSVMSTTDVADMVFHAIKNKEFYILTHKGSNACIEKRMNTILNNDNPSVTGPEEFPVE